LDDVRGICLVDDAKVSWLWFGKGKVKEGRARLNIQFPVLSYPASRPGERSLAAPPIKLLGCCGAACWPQLPCTKA